jgi:Family of unknown function (DUF6714)
MEPSTLSTKKNIASAFAATVHPGNDNLVATGAGIDPESREIADAFRDKRWQEVSSGMVRQYAEALPLLTPDAFRYFLPAYMMASIDDYPNVDVARDSVVFNLVPPGPGSEGWQIDFFNSRAQQFNPVEAGAIRCFLELMRDRMADEWATEDLGPPQEKFDRTIRFWASRQ